MNKYKVLFADLDGTLIDTVSGNIIKDMSGNMNRETVVSEVYNCNCMDFMRSIPDKHFDLAVVDPPYGSAGTTFWGGGNQGSAGCSTVTSRTGGTWAAKYGKKS